ncbi:DivIVA domain-containing protein [Actinoallomurus sp. NPDC050550]|uniref:DivIVA domain-containing protein n=1 Tax=Actinoallomurus sp. NPDC050550 TaxID=3154937 RepID=UPI0033E7A58A
MNDAFDITWRGYDRRQVDEYLRRLADDPTGTPRPTFDVVLRGYDRRQVDRYLAEGDRPDDGGPMASFFGS